MRAIIISACCALLLLVAVPQTTRAACCHLGKFLDKQDKNSKVDLFNQPQGKIIRRVSFKTKFSWWNLHPFTPKQKWIKVKLLNDKPGKIYWLERKNTWCHTVF